MERGLVRMSGAKCSRCARLSSLVLLLLLLLVVRVGAQGDPSPSHALEL